MFPFRCEVPGCECAAAFSSAVLLCARHVNMSPKRWLNAEPLDEEERERQQVAQRAHAEGPALE